MTFLKNTISLLAIFSIIPTAHAAAARPSIMNSLNTASAASRRMPSARTSSLTSVINTTTQSSTGILDEIECIDAYTECIASDDTCGSDFEECTTNVLFHAQMPKCTSTLLQCTSAGINRLFGTTDGNVASLSNVDSYVAGTGDTEVARYTFPSDGSVMGQRIIAGAIANTYDTQSCVKNYMRCLNKDDVCGADFELCTDDKDFKKQALYCESTLARCQTEGLKELFGDSGRAAKGSPAVGSRIEAAITSGAELAALNAVTTCYKTADNCLLSVCKQNPLRCIEGTSVDLLQAANKINADGTEDSAVLNDQGTVTSDLTKSNINRFLRSSCEDKIGSNKYCHMTVFEKTPTKKDLANIDKISEVFEDILDSRKGIVLSQVQGLAQKFDSNAKAACTKTIQECAMRTCGGGSGAACWTQVYGDNGTKSIGKDTTDFTPYSDIETGCAAIVNTDPNCVYAAQSVSSTATTYNYDYIDGNAFQSLFGASDPIGAVASLNSLLATSYNAAAIENMGKQCQKLANSCVRSMCGNDFVNCYRNRTDIYSNLTDTSNTGFDKSMNKVGGVLDYTIVLGLCADTVRNADTCSEHLKIAKASINTTATANTWGDPDASVSSNWRTSGQGLLSFKANGKDSVQKENENGELLCKNSKGDEGVCDTCSGTDSCDPYNIAVMQSVDAYKNSYAVTSLFKELIADLEIEAQAKYNAKLTKQQNMCLAANAGGIMGGNDMSSIYKWVKLGNGGRVPNDYSIQGLKTSQFKASNDLYGSFCAVRVTLQSDDPDIMAALSGNYAGQTFKRLGTGNHELRADTNLNVDLSGSASRYFAIGDPITCGSWLSMTEIEKLAQVVEAKAKSAKEKTQNTSLRTWMPILGAAGGALGGAFLGDAIQDGSALSGLLDKPKVKSKDSTKSSCQQWKDKFASTYDRYYADKIIAVVDDADKTQRATALLGLMEKTGMGADEWKTISGNSTAPSGSTTALCYNNGYDNDCLQKEAKARAKTAINSLVATCEAKQEKLCETNPEADGCKEKTWWQRDGGTLVGSLVTGAATAGLAYAVTDSVLNAELDKAGQEAYQAFMDSIGSKIHCYIGSQEVATYGQVIETSME